MQLRFGEAGDIKAMVDDRIVQRAVFAVGVAHVDGRQDHAARPGVAVLTSNTGVGQ